MKNLFRVVAVLVGLLASSSVSAQCGPNGCCPAPAMNAEFQANGALSPNVEPVDYARCAEKPVAGECWCKFQRQVPSYCCVPRCVTITEPCTKTVCTYEKECYDVQKCRMVPEYYTVKCYRDVPRYTQVPDCKTRQVWVNDKVCNYRTECYWKKVCNAPGEAAAPACCN